MPIQIKQATIDDLESVSNLFDSYRVFYRQESNIDAARTFINERLSKKDSVILFAKSQAGNVLGFTQLYPSFSSVSMKRLWVLNDLYVNENTRRVGVAQALLNEAADYSKKTSSSGLLLETAEDNISAQKLYKKNGWTLSSSKYYIKTN